MGSAAVTGSSRRRGGPTGVAARPGGRAIYRPGARSPSVLCCGLGNRATASSGRQRVSLELYVRRLRMQRTSSTGSGRVAATSVGGLRPEESRPWIHPPRLQQLGSGRGGCIHGRSRYRGGRTGVTTMQSLSGQPSSLAMDPRSRRARTDLARADRRAWLSGRCESLRLHLIELGLGDRSRVEELLGRCDLIGARAATARGDD